MINLCNISIDSLFSTCFGKDGRGKTHGNSQQKHTNSGNFCIFWFPYLSLPPYVLQQNGTLPTPFLFYGLVLNKIEGRPTHTHTPHHRSYSLDLPKLPPLSFSHPLLLPMKSVASCMKGADALTQLFPFKEFNKVQSACVDTLLGSDENTVVSAPTGSGKRVCLIFSKTKFWQVF